MDSRMSLEGNKSLPMPVTTSFNAIVFKLTNPIIKTYPKRDVTNQYVILSRCSSDQCLWTRISQTLKFRFNQNATFFVRKLTIMTWFSWSTLSRAISKITMFLHYV